MNNPTSRMQTIKPVKITEEDKGVLFTGNGGEKPEVSIESPKVDEGVSTLPKVDDQAIPPEELVELDMQTFYFTGKLSHEFKIAELKVTLKLLSSNELSDTHKILWDLLKSESSTDMVNVEHAIAVMSRMLMKYGKMDLESKTVDERNAIIRDVVPGILIPKIMKKYSILEKSAEAAFADKDSLKN